MRKRIKNKAQIPDEKPIETHLFKFTRQEEREINKAKALSQIFFLDYGKAHNNYIKPKPIQQEEQTEQEKTKDNDGEPREETNNQLPTS